MPMPPGSIIQEFNTPSKNVLRLDLVKQDGEKASKFGDLVRNLLPIIVSHKCSNPHTFLMYLIDTKYNIDKKKPLDIRAPAVTKR